MKDLLHAFRGLRRYPGFAALAIASMALGIGANTTMYSLIHAVFLRPLPFPNQDRLVTLWETDTARGISERRVSPANFADWRPQINLFEELGVLFNWSGPSHHFNVAVAAGGYERVDGIYASSGFFRVMGVRPVLGGTLEAEDDHRPGRRRVVIGYRYWQERFGGDPAIVGKTVNVDTFRGGAFEIAGVMPASFDLPHGAQLWLSLADSGAGPMPRPDDANRCCAWYTVLGRLEPAVSIAQAEAEMTAIARRVSDRYPAAAAVSAVRVTPLRDTLASGRRFALFALFAAAGCILLIVCVNVANLMLSRAVGRRREILTRKALGATRWRLARQLFAESLVLSAAGAAAGLLVSLSAEPVVSRLMSDVLVGGRIRTDWTVLLFTAAVTLASAVVCGLAPLAESQFPDWTSRGQTETIFSRRMRSALVVSEIALAVMLVSGAGLLIRTVARLSAVDMGFRTERLLTVTTDLTTGPLRTRGNSARFLEEIIPRIAALPGVRAAGATTAMPFETGAASQAITREDRPPQASADSPQVIQIAVTPRFFETMGMRLLAGRNFAESDMATGKLVAIVNETAAGRYWRGEDPIGKRFAIGSRERFGSFRQVAPGQVEWREIVGVVSDIRSAGPSSQVEPEVYYCYRQFPIYGPSLVVRTERDPAAAASAIRHEIRALNPGALITQVRTMDQVASESIASPRLRAMVASAFSLIALLLGMLGVYGVVSYTVTQRTPEIGVRMALGACPDQISRMVVASALRLTALGVAAGIAGSLAASRWISTLLFGVEPADPVTFFGACALLALAALAASYPPARRAARVDPGIALRSEG